MSTSSFASLAYKLLGVFALLRAVEVMPLVFSLVFSSGLTQGMNPVHAALATVFPFLIFTSGGVLLIVASDTLARMSIRDSSEAFTGVTAADIQSILFSSVGLLLVGLSLQALPRIVLMSTTFLYDDAYYRADIWVQIVGRLLELLVGTVLFIKGSTLVSLLRRRWNRARIQSADGRCPHCGFWFESSSYRAGASVFLCSNCKQELPREMLEPTE